MNSLVFILCSAFGFQVGNILPEGQLATFAYILITYHLVLVFFLIKADHKKGLSLPIGSTVLTHLACLAVVVGLAMGRHYIPFFGIVRYFLPGIAPFEAQWLFSGGAEKKEVTGSCQAKSASAAEAAVLAGTAQDYDEFLQLLAQGKRPFKKRGLTLKDEYGLWLVARAKSRTSPRMGSRRN